MAKGVPFDTAMAELRADLIKIAEATDDAMGEELADVADTAVGKIHGSHEEPFLTGKTRASARVVQDGDTQFRLTSDLPQAGPWNFGGTIKPRGAPIEIPRTEFFTTPVEKEGGNIEEKIADRFDSIAHRHGFV